MNLFAKKPTPKEAAKEAKREARREMRANQRELDREIRELDRQEKQLIMELKQRAKAINSPSDPALKALAKQMVTVKQQREKLMSTKSQMGAMAMHATTIASTVAAASAFGTMTETLKTANQQMNLAETQKIMAEFQRENERLVVKEEMMDDALMDAFDQEETEEEAEKLTNQVLAELGVELDQKMVGLDAPKVKPVGEEALSTEEQDALESVLPDLRARLNAL